jgi:hypothetical protein
VFPVALLLLNSKSLSKRFVGSIRTVRAKIVSGSKGEFNGISHSGLPPTCFGFYQEWAV